MAVNKASKLRKRAHPTQSNNLFSGFTNISPLTENQGFTLLKHSEDMNIVLYGYPGTGKTYLACALALECLKNREVMQIRIIRSCVPSRDMGFLPGSEAEKMEVYERPYRSIVNSLLGRDDAYDILKKTNQLVFESSSFLRGVTYDETYVIVDEFQSMSYHELFTIATRMGLDSRIMFCGDMTQNDLRGKKFDESGMPRFLEVVKQHSSFECIQFNADDIVRSNFVKELILISEKLKEIS